VLPRAVAETTLRFELDEARAIDAMNRWAGQPLPLSATAFVDGSLWVRLSGAKAAVDAALAKLGGERPADAEAFWTSLRNQTHAFFRNLSPLWRLSLRSTTAPLGLGAQLIEWNGSLRWIAADLAPDAAHRAAQSAGGHATLYRGGNKAAGIQRLAPPVLALHQRIKRAIDPNGVFVRHRIHP